MDDEKKGRSDECVSVVVRCRPLNRKEKEENRTHIVTIDLEARQVVLRNPAAPDDDPKSFTFDGAYDENTQQRIFYEECCFSMIESVLEGFNGTIFAYGQTGCGKSFTMQGPSNNSELRGVIPNSFTHIFDTVRASKDVEYLIRCSYLEIYNEEIKDLLGGHNVNKKDNAKCEVKEDPQRGVFVKGLTDVVVETEEQMNAMLEKGLSYRTTSSTLMNAESSRSHSIFTIVVEMSSTDKDTGKEMLRAGKLNLVDLAGSERQKKTGATGDLLKEGAKINLSLSALGNVISALSEGKGKHIPYRDSKLTRLLQDSLGGNTKTLMVAAISPADYNFDETMSTLRYANRAKNIKNKPKINEDPKDTMIREFKEEIERLRKLLEQQATLAAGGGLNAEMVGNLQREASSTSIHAAGVSQKGEITSFVTDDGGDAAAGAVVQGGGGGYARKRIARAKQEADEYLNEGGDEDEDDEEEGDNDEEAEAGGADTDGGSGSGSGNKKPRRKAPAGAVASEAAAVPAPEPIIREVILERERIVVEKEIVTVEVERIPEEHLYEKQALEEYSNAVAEERDFVSAQLKLKESEIEKERRLREELSQRLVALQSKLVGHHDDSSTGGQAMEESSDLAAQRQAADRSLQERRLKAKKKREERESRQQAELERVLYEKQAMEEELEELRNSAAASAGMSEIQENMLEKKLNKLKKKYEKKIKTLMVELDDAHEEFQFERQKLVDDMVEQQKDAKLYEQICRSILTEKDLKRIIDKSRWSEDDEEWVLPATKRRSVDTSPRGNTKGKLPEIPHSASLAASVHTKQGLSGPSTSASVARLEGNAGSDRDLRDRDRDREKGGGGGLTLPSAFLPPPNGGYSSSSQNSARGGTGSGAGTGAESRQRKRESAASRRTEATENEYSGSGHSSAGGSGGGGSSYSYNPQAVTSAPIPMLMLSGGIASSSNSVEKGGSGGDHYSSGHYTDDVPARDEEKKKKRRGKKKRRNKSSVDSTPGEDWGFAEGGGGGGGTGGGGGGGGAAGYNEPEYSDDEDFQQMDQDWENDYEPSNGNGYSGSGGNVVGGGGGGGGKEEYSSQGGAGAYPAVSGASGGGGGGNKAANSKSKPKSGIPPIDPSSSSGGRNKASSILPQLF